MRWCWRRFKWILLPLSGLGGLIVLFAEVPATTAKSNFTSWFSFIRVDALGRATSGAGVNKASTIFGLSLLVGPLWYLALRFIWKAGERFERTRTHGAPARGPRQFLSSAVTLATLRGLYDGRTDLEGEKLAQAYAGKWIKLRGNLANITRPHSDDAWYLAFEGSGSYALHIRFDGKKWGGRLETLQIGQEVALAGWLGKPGRFGAWFFDCELIPLAEANDAMSVRP